MDIRDKPRLYPYPVLSGSSDDYKSGFFTFRVARTLDYKDVKYDVTFLLECRGLVEKIVDTETGGKHPAEILLHIECPRTSFRKFYTTDELKLQQVEELKDITGTAEFNFTGDRVNTAHLSVKIPQSKLSGNVSVCAFIVAAHDITDYWSDDFNDDYAGLKFDISRGSILAVGGQYVLPEVKNTEDLAKIPSIFTVCGPAGDSPGLSVNMNGERIAVHLPDSDAFQSYKMMVSSLDFIQIFHAAIIFPALMSVFEELRSQIFQSGEADPDSQDGMEAYSSRQWFAALTRIMSSRGMPLTRRLLLETSPADLAQKLLENPVSRALNAVKELGVNQED